MGRGIYYRREEKERVEARGGRPFSGPTTKREKHIRGGGWHRKRGEGDSGPHLEGGKEKKHL